MLMYTSGYASQHNISLSRQEGHPAQNTLGCMAGFTFALVCVASASQLKVIQ